MYFGDVIAIINGIPVVYNVTFEEIPVSTSNALQLLKYCYKFLDSKSTPEKSGYDFAVIVTSKVADFYIKDFNKFHNDAIRYGLCVKKQNPGINTFQLKSDDYESFLAKEYINGQLLRRQILSLFYIVNSVYPKQYLSVCDLSDNINAEKAEIENWVKALYQAKYLIVSNESKTYRINRGQVKQHGFAINLAMEKEVKEILEPMETASKIDYLHQTFDSGNFAKLIAAGEGQSLEFKETLRFDIKRGMVNKELEYEVAEAISAFMNSEGGIVLIGISDSGEIKGIERDIETLTKKRNFDGFRLCLNQVFIDRLTVSVASTIKSEIIYIEEKPICVAKCNKATMPTHVKDFKNVEHFFIRVGPSDRELKGSELAKYLLENFRHSK